jgi:hypothetical protein
MRKLAGEPIGLWRQNRRRARGSATAPTAVFRNWYSGTPRKTAPVLSDKASHLTVSNESSEILCAREVAR